MNKPLRLLTTIALGILVLSALSGHLAGIVPAADNLVRDFLAPPASARHGQASNCVHIDSWEAGGQDWTATFPAEFRKRRGYQPAALAAGTPIAG